MVKWPFDKDCNAFNAHYVLIRTKKNSVKIFALKDNNWRGENLFKIFESKRNSPFDKVLFGKVHHVYSNFRTDQNYLRTSQRKGRKDYEKVLQK